MGVGVFSDTDNIQDSFLRLSSNTSGEQAVSPIVSLPSGILQLSFYAKFESSDECSEWARIWVSGGTTRYINFLTSDSTQKRISSTELK